MTTIISGLPTIPRPSISTSKLISRQPPEMVAKLGDIIKDFVAANIQGMMRDIDAGSIEPTGDTPELTEGTVEAKPHSPRGSSGDSA